MGVPALLAGISSFFAAENGPVTDRTAERERAVERHARSADNAHLDQPDAAPATQADTQGAGVYHVADAVVFQLQLQSVSFESGSSQAGGNKGNAAPPDPGPQAGAAWTTDPSSNAIARQATQPDPKTAFVSRSTAEDAVANTAPGVATTGDSSLQSQKVQLRAALQALGLSPAAIQDVMTVAQLLAQIAPSVFQNFVTQMVYLAKSTMAQQGGLGPGAATQAALGAPPAAQGGTGAATPTAGSQSAAITTPAPAPQGNNGTPARQIELASVQVTEAEVQVTVNQSGQSGQNTNGTTSGITLEAQAVNVQAVELLVGSPEPATATTSQTSSANHSIASPAAQALTASA